MIRNISIQFEVKFQNFGVMLDAIQKGKVMINADLSEVLALSDGTTKLPHQVFQPRSQSQPGK